jgi:hypothetical protein
MSTEFDRVAVSVAVLTPHRYVFGEGRGPPKWL